MKNKTVMIADSQEHIGFNLRAMLETALFGVVPIHKERTELVNKILLNIDNLTVKGDWLSGYNGTMFTKTFEPESK